MIAARGVSLLEALVALTIIGSAFGAILSLQSQLVLSLEAVQRAHARAIWMGNINEIASSLDSKAIKSGRLEITRNVEVKWNAAGPGWEKPNRVSSREAGNWIVRLTPMLFEVRADSELVLSQRRLVVTAESTQTK